MSRERAEKVWEAIHIVATDVCQEVGRQFEKWGEQNHPNGTGNPAKNDRALADMFRIVADSKARSGDLTWRDILLEEVYEAMAEKDAKPLRGELVQVGAVVTSWIASIDRKEGR